MRMRRVAPLLLLAVIAACGGGNDDGSGFEGTKDNAYSLFDPVAASAVIPFPFDGLFDTTPPFDGTLNIPNTSAAPFVDAANQLDGFSTTASLFTDFIGYVDVAHALDINPTTHLPGVLLIDSTTLTPLVPGVDYRVQSSTAIDPATGLPLNQLRTRMLIEPLKPLKPSTKYIAVVTRQVQSTDGVPAEAADLFRVIRSTTPVAQQTEPALSTLSPAQQATLEAIRGQFAPIFAGLAAKGIARENIVIAWPFTTQNTTVTLSTLGQQATGRTITAVATGLNSGQVLPGAPATADVYVGSMTVPYYLDAPSEADPTAPLTTYWKADTSQPAPGNTVLPALSSPTAIVTCSVAEPSVSTTTCYPLPLKKSEQRIPVILTIPNAASGKTMPGGGIAKLLDGSATFGPRISAGLLAASGGSIKEGNDNYETFLRFAQTVVDSGDPLNFATAAATNHPILMLEVKGDAVVPNCTIAGDANCPATDTIPISGYLSGSDPLARVLGLGFVPGPAQTDTLVTPVTTQAQVLTGAAARNNVVRYASGTHGSILDPGSTPASAAVTCEMQGEAATFVATNGTVLKIGNPCPGS
ncbi:MAG: hypothetical protein ACREVL_05130 [Solimonas sp.]